ncbi:MAG TPA: hypothetical protein VFP10_14165, partial [Candidatus Eisenbacteria bacterium]|nr:hypothetical protein [Candidatus Eisenbacteria bacterium]
PDADFKSGSSTCAMPETTRAASTARKKQSRCRIEAEPVPPRQHSFTLPELDDDRSCGEFGTSAVVFPH